MTLGPSLIVYAWLRRKELSTGIPNLLLPLIIFGRVPLFFYVVHLYLIHLAAVAIAFVDHQPSAWLLHGGFFRNDLPENYGYDFPIVWFFWACFVVLLYWPCAWFARFKQERSTSWLS